MQKWGKENPVSDGVPSRGLAASLPLTGIFQYSHIMGLFVVIKPEFITVSENQRILNRKDGLFQDLENSVV